MAYLGIDIGGTSIKGAVVEANGQFRKLQSCPTRSALGVEQVAEDIATLILQLAQGETIEAVGVSSPGTVDTTTARYSANVGWENYPLKAVLESKTELPIVLSNDANAAAFGEAKVGVGKDSQSCIIVTLGTGVGGGVVIDGKLLLGYSETASELGHMIIAVDGEPCSCGNRGCWEAYASATALIRMTKTAMQEHPNSLLHAVAQSVGEVNAQVPFLAREQGDPVAEALVARYIHSLAVGIANLVNIFSPERIALSGGIANQGDALLVPLREEVRRMEYGAAYTQKHPQIVCCSLGYEAGIVGAALFAHENLGKSLSCNLSKDMVQ